MNAPQPVLINLLETNHSQVKRKRRAFIIIVLIITMLGILAGVYFSALNVYRQQLAINKNLVGKIDQYHTLQASLEAGEVFNQEFIAKRNSVTEVEALQVSHINVLEELSRALPPGIIINIVQIKVDKISITGVASGYEEVARFLSGLRKSSVFDEVQMLSSETDTEREEIIFSIETSWGVKRK